MNSLNMNFPETTLIAFLYNSIGKWWSGTCSDDFESPNRIEGTTGVDIASGLHWYLKHWCGSHISWDKTGGSQLFSVPNAGFLPRVHSGGVSVQRPIPWSYYQNAVTSSCKLLLCVEFDVTGFCFVFMLCDFIALSGFGRFLRLVGLGKMGKGNWLDGSAGCQLAACVYGTRGYLAESIPGRSLTYLR